MPTRWHCRGVYGVQGDVFVINRIAVICGRGLGSAPWPSAGSKHCIQAYGLGQSMPKTGHDKLEDAKLRTRWQPGPDAPGDMPEWLEPKGANFSKPAQDRTLFDGGHGRSPSISVTIMESDGDQSGPDTDGKDFPNIELVSRKIERRFSEVQTDDEW